MQDAHKIWLYLIEMQLLLEDRLDFLRTNFHDRIANLLNTVPVPPTIRRRITARQPDEDPAAKLINMVIAIDPDPQKKNTQWLLTALVRKNHPMPLEDLLYAKETLTKYAEMKQARLLPKEHMDINSFRSLSEINAFMRGEQEQQISAEDAEQQAMMQEAKVLYDGPDARVLVPLTQKAACYFGRNTDWCTAWGNHQRLGLRQQGRYPSRSSHYSSYVANGAELFIIEIKPNGPLYQYSSEYNQFMDAQDRSLSPEQVRALFKQHPNIMRAIGEDKFVKTHLKDLGLSFFSPQALLRANPRMLLGSVKTLDDYYALPEAVQKQPETIAAILLTLPEIGEQLPKELLTPQVATALRGASHGQQISGNTIKAFELFPVLQWTKAVVAAAIDSRRMSAEQIADAARLNMEQLFTIHGYTGYKLVVPGYETVFYLVLAQNHTHWFWIKARADKLTSISAQPDAAIDRGSLVPTLLNAIGLPPEFDFEQWLGEELGVFYGKQYGRLEDVSKPDIKTGNVTIHRLVGRHMWIGSSPSSAGRVTRLWLKGTTLKHDNSKYLGDNYAEAVRLLAVKYKVRQVDDAESYGIVNGKGRIYADFPSLLAYAKTLPDVAYVTADEPKKKLFFAAMLRWGNKPLHEEQEVLYQTLRSDQIKAETTETDRVYDLTIPHISIQLPDTNRLMQQYGLLTDKAIQRKIALDWKRAVHAAIKVVNSYDYAHVTIVRSHGTPSPDEERLRKLVNVLDNKTNDAVRERRRDTEKYAAQTDLSGRFAALNAFKKRSSF